MDFINCFINQQFYQTLIKLNLIKLALLIWLSWNPNLVLSLDPVVLLIGKQGHIRLCHAFSNTSGTAWRASLSLSQFKSSFLPSFGFTLGFFHFIFAKSFVLKVTAVKWGISDAGDTRNADILWRTKPQRRGRKRNPLFKLLESSHLYFDHCRLIMCYKCLIWDWSCFDTSVLFFTEEKVLNQNQTLIGQLLLLSEMHCGNALPLFFASIH